MVDCSVHEWEDTIAHRSNGRNCPICSGHRVKGFNDLALRPDLALQWHPYKKWRFDPRNGNSTIQVEKVWWLCSKVTNGGQQ